MSDRILDIAVVGAGPCGLSAGIAARQAGLDALILDEGCVTRAITLYPVAATFFSTADRLELGGVPFIPSGDKPSRADALRYYRELADRFRLPLRLYETVESVTGGAGDFEVRSVTAAGERRAVRARNVILATGYAGRPVPLGVPGEDLPKVTHWFDEAHRYFRQECVVVGAGNSAVEAALALHRAGARVTLVHFLDRLDRGVKPWILPDIRNRIDRGEIAVRWETRIAAILPDRVRLRHERTGAESELPNDFVLAMTGYRPDVTLVRALGVGVDPETGAPSHDPETMETDVPGVFIAGVLAGGHRPDRVFIEDGRHHGPLAVRRILDRMGREPAGEISLGVPPSRRPPDPEPDGLQPPGAEAAPR